MSLEEKLLNAKHFHKQMIDQIDIEAFSNRLFQSLYLERKANRKRLFRKRKIAATAIPILILPLAGFTYAQYLVNWKHSVTVTSSQDNHNMYPFSRLALPYEHDYLNDIKEHARKIEPLSDARATADFPIREPEKINGWSRTISEGVIMPLNIRDTRQNPERDYVTDGPLFYFDVYSNSKGQQVSVKQESYNLFKKDPNGVATPAAHGQMDLPANAHVVNGLGDNFAWTYTEPNGKRTELNVLHKEESGVITQFQIDGNTDLNTLQSFAKVYLQSPDN